jgi:hypothetical protein
LKRIMNYWNFPVWRNKPTESWYELSAAASSPKRQSRYTWRQSRWLLLIGAFPFVYSAEHG